MPAVREEIFAPMALALVTVIGSHPPIGADGGSDKVVVTSTESLSFLHYLLIFKLFALLVEKGTNHNCNIILDILVDPAEKSDKSVANISIFAVFSCWLANYCFLKLEDTLILLC